MGRRWKWFWRPGRGVLDLTGQVVPDGEVPGRWRRQTVEQLVPELAVTSRCDGATVYQRPGTRPAARAVNQRAAGYTPQPPGTHNQRQHQPAPGTRVGVPGKNGTAADNRQDRRQEANG